MLSPNEAEALTQAVVELGQAADWVVLSGSLPPGLPDSWYSEMVALLHPHDCRVAVDTSDRPLGLAAGLDRAAPDLLKPNAEELAGLVGVSADTLEVAVRDGDAGPSWSPPGVSSTAVWVPYWPRWAPPAVLVDGSGAWVATRRRSSRAALSAPETQRWPDTCAPTLPVPQPRTGCEWRWPTAAPRPRCLVPHCLPESTESQRRIGHPVVGALPEGEL